jgi:alanyl aminopeptidase
VKEPGLLRMFENWLGDDAFRKGIQIYPNPHAWKNATTDNLSAALSNAAGKDVSAAFRSFLDQRGIPLLSANMRCDGKQSVLELSQVRFVPIRSTDTEKRLWQLPACVRWNGGQECVELKAERQEFPLKASGGCPEWFHGHGWEAELISSVGNHVRESLTTPGGFASLCFLL